MRIVKWNPQERADAPDLTAMSYLVLGEFRRMARGALIGSHSVGNYAINGFRVAPTTAPSNSVEVTLDDAGALSFAFGAELIGSRIDYGQLIGGDNSDGNTEGAATQTVDFTPQPAATYTVQVRHTYSDSTSDNRAFWNPSANTEFIAAVLTRTLPEWTLRVSGTPSAEWMDLADVVWDGIGPIVTGNITDKRDFAFEGAAPHTQTTRLGTGGMPDFPRFFDRGTPTVGRNAVYPALRGVGRQIQDMKGPDDNGEWNWWNDPYLPLQGTVSTLARDKATSLRSLRTVHYTVGDGVRTFGDFNGYALGTGLDECLSYIELNANSIDAHVIIQLLINGDGGTTSGAFQIGNYTFNNTLLEIRGGGSDTSVGNELWWGSAILCAGTLTSPAFRTGTASSQAGVIFRGLRFPSPGSDAKLALIDNNSHCEMSDCYVQLTGTPAAPVLEIDSPGVFHVRDCRFLGEILLTGYPNVRGVWDRCYFQGEVAINGAGQHTFRDCYFSRGFKNGNHFVFLTDSTNVAFEGCRFSTIDHDTDMVHIDNSAGRFTEIRFRGCWFTSFDTSPSHAVGAGTNGSKGTGWHIFVDNDGGTVDDCYGIVIDDCVFNAGGTFASEVIDAGAVYIDDCATAKITDCEIRDFYAQTAGNIVYGVYLKSTPVGTASMYVVRGCHMHRFDPSNGFNYAVWLQDAGKTTIEGSHFNISNAVRIINAVNSDFCKMNGNQFDNAGNGPAIRIDGCDFCVMTGNQIHDCEQALHISSGTGNVFSGNTAQAGTVTAGVLGVVFVGGANTVINSNNISQYSGTGWDAIYLSANNCSVIGNVSSDGDLTINGTTGHVGANSTHNLMNAVNP